MGTATNVKEFRRRKELGLTSQSAKIHRLPERPVIVKDVWICGTCGEENDGTKCWNCGRPAD